MSEFEKYFKDEFFIIDSNNLENVETKLYGFIFDEGKIIKNNNLSELNDVGGKEFMCMLRLILIPFLFFKM